MNLTQFSGACQMGFRTDGDFVSLLRWPYVREHHWFLRLRFHSFRRPLHWWLFDRDCGSYILIQDANSLAALASSFSERRRAILWSRVFSSEAVVNLS